MFTSLNIKQIARGKTDGLCFELNRQKQLSAPSFYKGFLTTWIRETNPRVCRSCSIHCARFFFSFFCLFFKKNKKKKSKNVLVCWLERLGRSLPQRKLAAAADLLRPRESGIVFTELTWVLRSCFALCSHFFFFSFLVCARARNCS